MSNTSQENSPAPARLGLIAGGGEFPLLVAKEAALRGHEVFVAGLKGVTSPELEKLAAKVRLFRLGQISAPIDFFRENGVTQVALAGLIKHNSIFGGIMPDLRAGIIMARLKDMRAQTIFAALVEEFARDGLEIVNSAQYLGHLFPKAGHLTKTRPDADQMKSVALGWKAAKTLADLDIGLCACVASRMVLALEGAEGTDACIRRAGELCRQSDRKASGLVVVKVARSRQDMRFDLPVIGTGTLASLKEAGAAVLTIEAGKTLILDKENFLSAADKAGIAVLALNADGQM